MSLPTDRIRSGGVYAVRPTEGGLWQVVDEEDRTIFSGSKRDCEDWLDAWENLSPENRSLKPFAWFGRLMRKTWARFFRSTPE